MIKIRHIILFFLCLMVSLNGFFLILTTGKVWPNILLLVGPIAAVFTVDIYRKFHINSVVAGFLGFAMCGIGIFVMINSSPSEQLGIVSELTTYLLTLLIFQRKSPRLYWQLAILSVLQTVVASVYSGTLKQAVAYIVYYSTVLIFLSLVSIYRDQLLADGQLDPWHNLKTDRSIFSIFRFRSSKHQYIRTREYSKTVGRMSMLGTPIAIMILTSLSVACGMGFFGALPNRNRFTESDFLRLWSKIGASARISSLETNTDPVADSTEALRVKFVDPRNDQPVRLSGDVYLPRVSLEVLGKDKTSWNPYAVNSKANRIIGDHPEKTRESLGATYLDAPRSGTSSFRRQTVFRRERFGQPDF